MLIWLDGLMFATGKSGALYTSMLAPIYVFNWAALWGVGAVSPFINPANLQPSGTQRPTMGNVD